MVHHMNGGITSHHIMDESMTTIHNDVGLDYRRFVRPRHWQIVFDFFDARVNGLVEERWEVEVAFEDGVPVSQGLSRLGGDMGRFIVLVICTPQLISMSFLDRDVNHIPE